MGVFASGGGLDAPKGLAFDSNNNLLVASSFSDEVLLYDGQTGHFIEVFASGGGLDMPNDILLGPDGHLYVAGGWSHAVLRYDGQTGDFIDVFAFGGGLYKPVGLAFIPEPASLCLLALGGLLVVRRRG